MNLSKLTANGVLEADWLCVQIAQVGLQPYHNTTIVPGGK